MPFSESVKLFDLIEREVSHPLQNAFFRIQITMDHKKGSKSRFTDKSVHFQVSYVLEVSALKVSLSQLLESWIPLSGIRLKGAFELFRLPWTEHIILCTP